MKKLWIAFLCWRWRRQRFERAAWSIYDFEKTYKPDATPPPFPRPVMPKALREADCK